MECSALSTRLSLAVGHARLSITLPTFFSIQPTPFGPFHLFNMGKFDEMQEASVNTVIALDEENPNVKISELCRRYLVPYRITLARLHG